MGAWPSRRGAEATNLAKRGHEIPLGQAVTFKTTQYGGGKINEKKPYFFVEFEVLFGKFPRLVLANGSQKASGERRFAAEKPIF